MHRPSANFNMESTDPSADKSNPWKTAVIGAALGIGGAALGRRLSGIGSPALKSKIPPVEQMLGRVGKAPKMPPRIVIPKTKKVNIGYPGKDVVQTATQTANDLKEVFPAIPNPWNN